MDDLGSSSHTRGADHTLPEYTQNVLPELNDIELPLLILTSHGHSPPLNPPPDLRVDVRNLPNPPKKIRDLYNGTSKRLQDWMKDDAAFVTRLNAIQTDIEAVIMEKMDEHEKKEVLKIKPKEDIKMDENEDADSSFIADADGTSADKGLSLRVGLFCAMGRHRSVAMVEELAKMSWPGWQVKVEHRDISKKRGQGKKAGGRDKKSRGTRGGSSSYADDDYE